MTERVDLEELDVRYLRDAGSNVRMVNLPIAQLRALIAELTELRQAQAGGWIACSERMPEPMAWVLIANDGDTQIAHWGGGPMWWCDRAGDDDGRVPVGEVTNWMALPAPPVTP